MGFNHQPNLEEIFRREFPDLYVGLSSIKYDIHGEIQLRFYCPLGEQYKPYAFKGSGSKRILIPPILPTNWNVSINVMLDSEDYYTDDIVIPYNFCPTTEQSTAVLSEWVNKIILEEVELIKKSMEIQKTLHEQSAERKKQEIKETELAQLEKLARKYKKKLV